MAQTSQYTAQLGEACRLVGELAGRPDGELVFQSRSGSPTQPWLEPDVCHRLRELTKSGISDAVVVPIGFLSDHMEVLYDLDTEARQLCQELVGLRRPLTARFRLARRGSPARRSASLP
jgi:ferrochelatase